jgi:hypothetical protein
MDGKEILAPVVALVAWSLIVMMWMVVTRLPAMKRAGINMKGLKGGRPGALDGVLDEQVQWKAHNYIHLMEQPTLFYAIAITLAVLGEGGGINATIAWVYVGLRVVHSIVQGTVNVIAWRFTIFALASLALVALTIHAAIDVCSHL